MKRFIIVAALAVLGATSALAGVVGGDIGPFGNTVFVRGGFNGWGAVDAMTWDGTTETYSAVLSIDAGAWEFKIADEGWANPDFGPTGDPVVTLGTPSDIGTAIGVNYSLTLAAAGTYQFVLSDLSAALDSGILTVTQIPVPAALLLFASGLAGFGFLRKRG